MENPMKLFRSVAVLTLSAASLSAGASLKPTDLLGEPTQAPSLERAIIIAVPDRTITITGDTKWVNVNNYEAIRFASNGAEFTWSFNVLHKPGASDLIRF